MIKISEGFEIIKNLSETLQNNIPDMSFNFAIVKKRSTPFKDWYKMEVPGETASKQSGVYFIADLEENILYIGKAGADNLGAEIWSKFRAPNKEGKFVNSPIAKWAPNDVYRKQIIDGQVLIAAVVIWPKEFASLVEVYLHIWCSVHGGLPPLNKRIG